MSPLCCILGVYTRRHNNWKTALVITKFANLVAFRYLVLCVALKGVLSDLQQM